MADSEPAKCSAGSHGSLCLVQQVSCDVRETRVKKVWLISVGTPITKWLLRQREIIVISPSFIT